jgi:hypothetical protein
MSQARKPRRFRRFTLIIVALVLIVFAISGLILFSRSRSPLNVEIVLVSPPQFVSEPAVFQIPQPSTASSLEVTQNFFRAEIQVRNLGTSSIAPGPYRGAVSLEIMETNSTNWIGANQHEFGLIYPIIKPGDSMNFLFRIPASATKWRVTCSYQRWFLPQRILKYGLRIVLDWLPIDTHIRDGEIHEAQSVAWTLDPPSIGSKQN